MGPNGSGKSTLANVLSGKNGYELKVKLILMDENLSDLSTLKKELKKEYF